MTASATVTIIQMTQYAAQLMRPARPSHGFDERMLWFEALGILPIACCAIATVVWLASMLTVFLTRDQRCNHAHRFALAAFIINLLIGILTPAHSQ